MVRKLAALAGAGAILLSLAVPAFAWFPMFGSKDVAIIKNNDVTAVANTGSNSQDAVAMSGGDVEADGTRYISTGDAHAKAKGVILANTHIGCGPCAGGGFGHKDIAVVKRNDVTAMADSGFNTQDAVAIGGSGSEVDADGSRTIYTGSAWAKAKGYIIVNTHLSFGGLDGP